MSFLKSSLVAVMGFLLGMVLAGVGGLSAGTLYSSFSNTENSKKIENYWSDTGLDIPDVEAVVSNSKCEDSLVYFRACLNAVAQNAYSVNLRLGEDGQLVGSTANGDNTEELSEQQLILRYRNLKTGIDFSNQVKILFAHTDPNKRSMLAAQMINSFMSVYVDPHTYILPSGFYNQVGSKIERSPYFVGLSYEKQNGNVVIQRIAKNSDADLAGLKSQDKVISINSEPVRDMSYAHISQILRNETATSFVFEIERSGKLENIRIDRSYRLLSHVQFNTLDENKKMGLITLSKFSKGVCEEMAKVIKQNTTLEGIVLDLRDNPGGQLDEAACVAGLFLGKNKKAYYVEYFDPRKPNEVVLTSDEQIYKGPLAVLVNSRSASASESLTGALQDYKRAVVVGRRTFGKGTFQEPEEWVLNPQVSLFKTQGRYLLPSRNGTQSVGIKPDVELPLIGAEKREEDIFFKPYKRSKKQYPSLKAQELVNSYDYNNCKSKLKLNAADDLYLRTGVDLISCSLDRKNSLALSAPATIN